MKKGSSFASLFAGVLAPLTGGATAVVASEPSESAAEQAPPAPEDWEGWLTTLFPTHFTSGFAERHEEYWDHVWAIELPDSPDPFVGVWSRGGGKSTGAETGAVALGVRDRRRYVLYVRATQKQADGSVSNIAHMLESDAVATYYPQHRDRLLSKYGVARGWRGNRLRTAGGLTVDAVGLDAASRGLKVEAQRPDLIIFDDIDDKLDSPATTAKKIKIITTSVMPAGAVNCAYLAIQNLIIADGFFTRMVDNRADYLSRRIVSGPHPAVVGLETTQEIAPNGTVRHRIVAGEATWEGQNLAICQKQIDDWGLDAFLKEAQHDVRQRAEGLALRYDPDVHDVNLTDAECRALVARGKVFGGLDFGWWRFAFSLYAADTDRVVTRVAELFSQGESHLPRAQRMQALCAKYGVQQLTVWGDAANPQDIVEINLRLAEIGSKIRVVPVGMENKLRRVGVTRCNDMLDRRTFRNRIECGDAMSWHLGQNADGNGTQMTGSRWVWEAQHWAYPVPDPGQAQVDDPDDDTADGGDMMAQHRYALMSWWRPPKAEEKPDQRNEHEHRGFTQQAGSDRLTRADARRPEPAHPSRNGSRMRRFNTPRR